VALEGLGLYVDSTVQSDAQLDASAVGTQQVLLSCSAPDMGRDGVDGGDPDEFEGGSEEPRRFVVDPWSEPASRRALGFRALQKLSGRLSLVRVDALPMDGAGKDLAWLCFGPQSDVDAWLSEADYAGETAAAVARWLAGEFIGFGNALASAVPVGPIIDALTACLEERQRNVLTWRADGETLDAVASIYDVTRERIRQIDNQARERLVDRILGLRAFEVRKQYQCCRMLERAARLVFRAACQEGGVLRDDTRRAWAERALPTSDVELLRLFWLLTDDAPDEFKHLFDPVLAMGHPFQGGRTDGPWTDTDVASLASTFAQLMGDQRRGWVRLEDVCSTSGLPKPAVEKLAPFARLTVYGDTVHEGRLKVKDIRRMAIIGAMAPASRALHEAEIVQSLIPLGFGTSGPLREVHDALADGKETFVSDGKGLWQMRQVLGDTVEDARADHPNLPPPMSPEEILDQLTAPGASFRHDRVPVLQGLSASADGFQRAAAERLQDALARLPSTEPRSIFQVLTPDDELKLRQWLGSSSRDSQLELTGNTSSSARAIIGLTALAGFTSVLRAECGSDYSWWVSISSSCGTARGGAWFHTPTQPTVGLRSALVEAATKFGLRHTFSFASDPWSTLVALQAGILPRDISLLAHWLSTSQPTVAMRQLIAPGPNHSASFALLWNVLVAFRRGRLGRAEVEAVAETSEWWPGWFTGDACRSCLARAQEYRPARPAEAPTVAVLDRQAVSPNVLPDEDGAVPTDVSRNITPSGPKPWTSPEILLARDGGSFLLALPSRLPFPAGPVALVGGGIREGGLIKNDGDVEWHSHRPFVRIDLKGPPDRPFKLERDSEVLQDIAVRLWAPDDYIVAFAIGSGPGSAFDPFLRPMPRTGSAALLLHRSLQTSVAADEEHTLDDSYLLRVFNRGIPTGATVSSDGEILWVAERQAESRRLMADEHAELILDGSSACWGGEADLVFTTDIVGFEPQRALVGGRMLAPTPAGNAWRFAGFPLLPGMDPLRRRGRVDGLLNGERVSLPAHVLIAHAPHGAALRTPSGWRPVTPATPFDAGKDGRHHLWVSLPGMVDDPAWTVFEGPRPVIAYRETGVRLDRRLLGLGEPLTIEHRVFNRTSGSIRVSDSVLDTGFVAACEHGEGFVKVRTATPVHWTEYHKAIGLSVSGILERRRLPFSESEADLVLEADRDIDIVCIFHAGNWLGTGYLVDDVEAAVSGFLAGAGEWKDKVAIALKARLPMLTPRTRSALRLRMQTDGGACLFALCRATATDATASYLLGQLLASWQPGQKLADALVTRFLKKLTEPGVQTATALEQITAYAPYAAARSVAIGLAPLPRRDRGRVVSALCMGLLPPGSEHRNDAHAGTGSSDVEEILLAEAIKSTGYDYNFLASKSDASIASLAWAGVMSPDRIDSTLDTCTTVAPVRRWLSAHLLGRVSNVLR
jgi:hypothetical protein